MKPDGKQYRRWIYIFLGIGLSAVACCAVALYYKQYIIATATGLVAVVQLLNYRTWKKRRS